jgi:hypothetical protein
VRIRADRGQHLPAGKPGHVEVEHDDTRRRGGEGGQRLRARRGGPYTMTGATEHEGSHGRQLGLVVNDEHVRHTRRLPADPPSSHAALQKMAGFTKPDGTLPFDGINDYITNLRNGLMPLAIPAGGIGVVAGGVMYLLGNQRATQLLMGVLIGMGLTLSAPGIVA